VDADIVSRLDDLRDRLGLAFDLKRFAGMRCIIADDQTRAMDFARRMLRDYGFEVVATFGDGVGVVDASARLNPDFVVLDISMRQLGGDVVGHTLLDQAEHPIVVMASSAIQGAISRPLLDRGAFFIGKPYNDLFLRRLFEALNVALPADRAPDSLEAG
jgi:FixJ family two-component response regulator